ncbi:MAG: hypothetical protein AAGD96_19110 [Chloroflexota bacterium]
MTNQESSNNYAIYVQGELSERWAQWFDDMAIAPEPERNVTVISGRLSDQAALHGLLNRVRNLGLTLIAVQKIEDEIE